MRLTLDDIQGQFLQATDGQDNLPVEIKQRRQRILNQKASSKPGCAFSFRSDVLIAADEHNLTIKEMALLALIHDRTKRPDDTKEFEKTKAKADQIEKDFLHATQQYQAAVNAWNALPMYTPTGERTPPPSKRKYRLQHLERRLNEYQKKADSIEHRIKWGCWFDSQGNRTRFCDTVGIKVRQFQKIKKKLLDLGLIVRDDLIALASRTSSPAYVSKLTRRHEHRTHYTVPSNFKIFGYFDPNVFDVTCTFRDKCYLSIIYLLMLGQSKKPTGKLEGDLDPAYVRKGSTRRLQHKLCRMQKKDEPEFIRAFDEDWGNVFVGSKHLCEILCCSPTTLTKLRKKWAFLIEQFRRQKKTSMSVFTFDKRLIVSRYQQDETYFDEFIDRLVQPVPELFERLDAVLNAGNSDELENQNKVIAPEIVNEYMELAHADKTENFIYVENLDGQKAAKRDRWYKLNEMMEGVMLKLGSVQIYRTYNVWQSYLSRNPHKDPNYVPPPPPPDMWTIYKEREKTMGAAAAFNSLTPEQQADFF